jgi:hypothetical protein
MLNRRFAYRMVVVLSLILAIIGAYIAFMLHPAADTNIRSVHLRAATAIVVAVTSLGGSLLFMSSLEHFKTSMRIAYGQFAVGILLFGVALLQLPIIGFLDAWNSWFADSGMVIAPFIFATLLMYAGMRRFALLLGIKTVLTQWRLVLGVAVLVTMVSFLGGHYLARFRSVSGTDLYIAIVAWSATTITFATLLARSVIDRIGPFYQSAMRWLVVALSVLTFAAWHEYAINYFMGNSTGYVAYGWSFWPFILSGFAMLKAGYAFTLLGVTVPYIPVHEAPGEPAEVRYADNLAALAALISYKDSPIAKDLQANATQTQTASNLVQSYNKLETYLTQKDPLRRFERKELRDRLQPGFRALVERNHDNGPAPR